MLSLTLCTVLFVPAASPAAGAASPEGTSSPSAPSAVAPTEPVVEPAADLPAQTFLGGFFSARDAEHPFARSVGASLEGPTVSGLARAVVGVEQRLLEHFWLGGFFDFSGAQRVFMNPPTDEVSVGIPSKSAGAGLGLGARAVLNPGDAVEIFGQMSGSVSAHGSQFDEWGWLGPPFVEEDAFARALNLGFRSSLGAGVEWAALPRLRVRMSSGVAHLASSGHDLVVGGTGTEPLVPNPLTGATSLNATLALRPQLSVHLRF